MLQCQFPGKGLGIVNDTKAIQIFAYREHQLIATTIPSCYTNKISNNDNIKDKLDVDTGLCWVTLLCDLVE